MKKIPKDRVIRLIKAIEKTTMDEKDLSDGENLAAAVRFASKSGPDKSFLKDLSNAFLITRRFDEGERLKVAKE